MEQTNRNEQDGGKLLLYGLGATGRQVLDILLDDGVEVALIVDRNQRGQSYRGIPIVALADLREVPLQGARCLIALHNHYVNINDIHAELSAFGFAEIMTLVNARKLSGKVALGTGYWLDYGFDYASHAAPIAAFLDLLEDGKSRDLAHAILRYRQHGNLADCPLPSSFDEYVPGDLPKYKYPLKLIDCGAFTGVAVEKFLAAGYQVASLLAFEPDLANFARLAAKDFPIADKTVLPLGTWSSTTQLRFSTNGSMASGLDPRGDTVIQCVRIDEVAPHFGPNLIKFDVEGAEIDTLHGLEQTIRSHRPNLCVSLYHKPEHLFEIPLLIAAWGLGYKFHLRVHEYHTFGIVLYCFQDELVVA